MSRVTPAEVKEIIDTDLSDAVIQIWIDSANTIVNDNKECIGDDESKLTQVELYLSAHFISMIDTSSGGKGIEKEKFEGMETTFSSIDASDKISSTVYGQTANMLSGGCLGKVQDRKAALYSVGGC